ncbi:MAG: MgtC/SapB family protein [Coxiellaceae bacterium]|nr:MAG: MgtC/SapB family protein [Coxiellaceae bacterium]
MDWFVELEMVSQVLAAFVLGAFIGWEREHRGMQAGIRTYGAIAIGACVFGLISIHGPLLPGHTSETFDITRIASNIVVGVGFLGAGVIFRQGDHVGGLTTAATLWSMAAVGLAVAFKMYVIAVLTTAIMFLMLYLPKMSWWKYISGKKTTRTNLPE